MNIVRKHQLLKIIFSMYFLLVSLIVVLITESSEIGSDLSIYTNIPYFIWVVMVGAILFGVSSFVISIFSQKNFANLWKLGLLLVLLINYLLLFLPFLRGYTFQDAGDHLSHIGYANCIAQSGIIYSDNIYNDNFYPIIHIIITQVSLILGLSIPYISRFIGPLFYGLFILYTYLFCREVMPSQPAKLSMMASTVLSCYYFSEIFPMGFAFITFPLFLYLYFKQFDTTSVSIKLCLLVVVLYIIFMHAVAASLLIFMLVIIEYCKPFSNLLLGNNINREFSSKYFNNRSLTLPLLTAVILIFWMWNHYLVWDDSISSFASLLSGELLTKPMVSEASSNFQRLGLNFVDILKLFFKIYGQIFIYFILSVIASISILKKRIPLNKKNMTIFFVYICFFVPFTIIWIVDYIKPLTALSSGRMQHFVSILFPPLVGLALYYIDSIMNGIIKRYNEVDLTFFSIISIINRRNVNCFIIISILSVCSLLAIFSYYDSTFTYKATDAISPSGVVGVQWLLETGNPNIKIIGSGVPLPFRIADATWGLNQKNCPVWGDYALAHFGYNKNRCLADSMDSPKYLILRPNYILKYYQDLYPTINKYTKNDLLNLDSDVSISLVYENNEINVWIMQTT